MMVATGNSLDDGSPLRIEMWGDIQCSWCYIQREILNRAIVDVGGAEVKFRTYSQFPHVHTGSSPPDDCFQEYHDAIGKVAAEVGLGYDCVNLQQTDSQKAHELIHFASARGKGPVVVDRLYKAHFEEGLDVGELRTLGAISAQCDLDRDEAISALEQGWCTAEVEQDNHLAYLLGVPGIPFITINGRYRFGGVQAPSALKAALVGARQSATTVEGRDTDWSGGEVSVGRLTGRVN